MADPTCVLNSCGKPQGVGTWCSVDEARTPLPLCEEHWKLIRDMGVVRAAPPCSQCGQRTPVCVDCSESIVFVPKSGFGQQGEWRHLAPPLNNVGTHLPRPKVFVS